MEKAEKLRPAQSFPFLCHSPRSSPERRAVPLRKSVSVSELVARYQSILDCESSMSKQEHPKLMERRYLSQTNVSAMGKKHALSQSHTSDMCSSKSTEDLPIPNISAPTRNLKGLLTSFDSPKATPRCKSFAPLKTPPPNGILRKGEADDRIMTTIQPLSMETKPHKDPSFPSSLQSIQRKTQWNPATVKWKDSPAKEGKLSHNRQAIISSVPDTADDSTTGRSYERPWSFLAISDNASHILHQGRGRSSALSVKELSAFYLSQTAAAAAQAGSPAQPGSVKDNSIHSPHSQKKSKPMWKEVCASCLKPVYSMERVVTDKVCVHRSCFCCQVCRRKLSLQNYAALHGVFYCQVHYKQMAGDKSRNETERLEHRLGDHQVQQVAMVGRGPQPQDWYNRAKKKTETREKPTSFNARCSLRLAEHRQELDSKSVLLGNKLRMGWPPSETDSLAIDGKAGKGTCSWKKPALSLQTYQAAGSRTGRVMLRGQEGKSVVEAVGEKGSFLPGVTYTKERGQAYSWPKTREQRDGEKIGDGDVPEGKRGGKVSQRVAAIQQGKAQLKRGPASATSPLILEPVKSPLCGSLAVHHATRQSTKPTNWMYLGGTRGSTLSAAELPVKENKVCGSQSTSSEGGTMPAMTDDKPALTTATPATAGDRHHLGERMKSPQPICVPGEPETRNTASIELKCGAEGVDPPENEAEEAHCLSGVSRTPYVPSGSLEPGGLSVLPEITELLNEKSKANTDDFPGKQMPVILGENMQPSSISHLPGIESKGAEFEKTKEVKPISTPGFLEEPSPEHTCQENKVEKSRGSSPGLPDNTDDHNVSCLQETEPQDPCGPLITNPHEDILRQDTKSPGKDFPVSADTALKGTCATWPSHDEVNNSKSKDPRAVLSGNIFHISEQPAKTLDSSKPNISLDKSRGHPVGEEKIDLKIPGESTTVPNTSRPGAQSKDTRSNQDCREMLGKGFRLGKKPFTTLFGSEDKGSALKKEITAQRKPTKPQSALVTLFGHSSEKKQNQQEKPATSSEQTNIDNRPEKPQGLLSSSSQAKQKASKNDQLPQPGKMDVYSKDIQESSGGFSDSTEGKETDVLLLAPGTSISCDDKHERTELDIHDELALNYQVQQQQDSCWPSLTPAQENQEQTAPSTSEGGTNPLHPPPELMPAADNSKTLIREGNHHDGPLLEIENLLSLDVQDTVIEDGIFFSPGNSEKLLKEAELQLDNMDFLEDNNVFFSGGQDFPSIASKIPNSDLQNLETETPPCFDPNPSELCQEIPAGTNAPLTMWDTSSLSLLAGQDEINIGDVEGIQSCALLQQLDPQCQAPKAVGDTFGLGLSAEGSAKKHLSKQEDNFPPTYTFTSHTSETFNQGVFDPFDADSTKMSQEAPEKMNRSRRTSGVEEDYGRFSSADLNVLNDGLLDQEFFI